MAVKTSAVPVALGYIRVSTQGQLQNGISMDAQVAKLKAYANFLGIDIAGIYADGKSAKDIKHRPGLQAVLGLVATGKISHVLIYKLDRAFRNAREALNVAEVIDKKSVALCSALEQIDTKSSNGKLFFTILAAMAEWERNIIGERTKDALAYKKTLGERRSRFIPIGQRLGANGKTLEVEPGEQEAIRQAKILHGEGYSLRKISSRLAKQGLLTRNGTRYSAPVVASMIKGESL
jgi:DNA invertase Pin-like site-specific DNA recombinase